MNLLFYYLIMTSMSKSTVVRYKSFLETHYSQIGFCTQFFRLTFCFKFIRSNRRMMIPIVTKPARTALLAEFELLSSPEKDIELRELICSLLFGIECLFKDVYVVTLGLMA